MGELCAGARDERATRVTVPCFLQGAVLAHRKLFSSCLEVESDEPSLLPLTVLTGIFAALGTGFLVLLFGRDSFAAVLIMLAWICTLCFVIYLLILAVSLFIRALTHLLRGGGQR